MSRAGLSFAAARWLMSLALVLPGLAGAANDGRAATAQWVDVLQKFVNDRGQIDFAKLAAQPESLDAYVAYIARESPQSGPGEFESKAAQLAYYINAYNALSMYNVIDSKIPLSLAGVKKVWFFGVKRFAIGGRSMSLYALENEIIRPFGDERIHFALNCMTVSCPRLPRQPFVAAMLDQQLDAQAREFFSEERNLQVDRSARVVRVSEILRFYRDDFLRHNPTLIAYINRYLPNKVPEDYAIEFIDYDWTVNTQNRAGSGV